MFKKSTLIFLSLAASMIGCGANGNPAKDVEEAREDQIEAARQEREESAELKKEQAEERAEQRYEHAEEQHARLPPAAENVANAEAKMTEQRAVYQADATARLEKSNARLAAAKAKLDKTPAAPREARRQLEIATTQRDLAKSELDSVRSVSNDQWKDATEKVNKSLDQLETMVGRAEEAVNKL
jgi:hypothetical protein